MFENASLIDPVDDKTYKAELETLRTQLLTLQDRLRTAPFPVILLLTGDDNAGRADVVNLLNELMDPRFIQTNAFDVPSDEERERPVMWRYWRAMPPKGHIGLFFGSWYSTALLDRLDGGMGDARWQKTLAKINRFEGTLVADGALLIKIWIHLGKKNLARRIKDLSKDPETDWLISARDRQAVKRYDKGFDISRRLVVRTSTPHAPWLIVGGSDANHRDLTVIRTLIESLRRHLEAPPSGHVTQASVVESVRPDGRRVLDHVDLSAKVSKADYRARLTDLQARLARLDHQAFDRRRGTVMVFEGWDAAGKGGVIRRMLRAMDARRYRVVRIAAPTEEERAHHYLWRFWRHMPRAGQAAIFDRSWYGRVLVERIEGYAAEGEWRRAFTEINEFEEQMVEHGYTVLKFWLHIDRDEQLARFKAREETAWKQYKITEEDYRNREKWGAYEEAVDQMVRRTSTDIAPWHLVPANEKRVARLRVLEAVCTTLEANLK